MTPSQWVAAAIERTLATTDARVALVVLNTPEAQPSPSPSRLQRWVTNRALLPLAAYERFDRWKFGVDRDWFQSADIRGLVGDAPVLQVVPRRTRYADFLLDADVETILSHHLDIAVRFGFRILRGRALGIARHGVWGYHHGDNRENRGGPPGLWEVLHEHPTTGSVLQVLSESLDGGRVLARAWSQTLPYSVGRNRERFYAQAVPLLASCVRDVASGQGSLEDDGVSCPAAYDRPLYTSPRGMEMCRLTIRMAGRYVANHIRARLATEQWFLAFRRTPRIGDDSGNPDLAPYRFKSIIPPKDRYWADPFPVRVADRDFLVFEELVHREGKAHIAVAELGDHGIVGEVVRVLEQPYHLSYPFLLEADGEHYMVPETASAGRVEIWRATRFPFEWEKCADLLTDRPRVDATIVRHEDRWWLFAAASEGDGESWDELELFWSKSPFGPWHPHPRNPLKRDVRSSRPAGRLFTKGGTLYRPAQDGSLSYGGALVIHEVLALTTRDFREQPVTRLDPRWAPGLVGVHTINAMDGLTVIDARRRFARW